jgi:hypothetical protein
MATRLIERSEFIDGVRRRPLDAAALADGRVAIEACRCAGSGVMMCHGWRLAPVRWEPVNLQ